MSLSSFLFDQLSLSSLSHYFFSLLYLPSLSHSTFLSSNSKPHSHHCDHTIAWPTITGHGNKDVIQAPFNDPLHLTLSLSHAQPLSCSNKDATRLRSMFGFDLWFDRRGFDLWFVAVGLFCDVLWVCFMMVMGLLVVVVLCWRWIFFFSSYWGLWLWLVGRRWRWWK